MNYKFSNLLGSPYRGGNLLLVESDLLSAGGNRVLQARVLSDPIAGNYPAPFRQVFTLFALRCRRT